MKAAFRGSADAAGGPVKMPHSGQARFSIIFLAALSWAVFAAASAWAGGPLCATCGRAIDGRYQVFEGKPYCSEACLEEALPKCAACGKPTLRYVKPRDSDRIYCSPECFQTSLPRCEICGAQSTHWVTIKNHSYCGNCASLPRCLNCRLPSAGKRLADGRHICDGCSRTAITDPDHAEGLFRRVREDLYAYLRLRTGHPIQFHLKDALGLLAVVGKFNSTEVGYYSVTSRRQSRRGVTSAVSETYAIYVISALSPPQFRNAAAHELAHDVGHALYPAVQSREDVEGFAEYVSALMNVHWRSVELNEEKLQNRSRDYAGGYAKFLQIGAKNGLSDVLEYMEKQNRKAGR